MILSPIVNVNASGRMRINFGRLGWFKINANFSTTAAFRVRTREANSYSVDSLGLGSNETGRSFLKCSKISRQTLPSKSCGIIRFVYQDPYVNTAWPFVTGPGCWFTKRWLLCSRSYRGKLKALSKARIILPSGFLLGNWVWSSSVRLPLHCPFVLLSCLIWTLLYKTC